MKKLCDAGLVAVWLLVQLGSGLRLSGYDKRVRGWYGTLAIGR